MYRAFPLLGELRYPYRLPKKDEAAERLDACLAGASRSRLKPFVKLARTIRQHKSGVLAAIKLDISNGRLDALNSRVRLISHRAHGFHPADALIAIVYLCCAGIQIDLPQRQVTPNRQESALWRNNKDKNGSLTVQPSGKQDCRIEHAPASSAAQ